MGGIEDPEVRCSVTQLDALERFVTDNADLERIEDTLREFDAFAFLGVSSSEETHSKILTWLLDPRGNHSTGSYFLTAFLLATGAVTEDQTRGIDWSNTLVQREWRNVVDGTIGFLDILILNAEAHFACAIENKVFSSEHTEQLTRYRKAMEQRYGGFDRRHLFLSRHGTLPERKEEREFWAPVDYKTVQKLVENTLERGGDPGNETVIAFLRQYVTTLRRRIVPDTEMRRMATKIYLQHREAIDLIYRHKEHYIDYLNQICEETIGNRGNWELIGPRDDKKLLAFVDTSWTEFGTFRRGTSLLPQSVALLWFDFDFRVTGEVTLILTISAGGIEDDVRRQLFDKTQGRDPSIFDPRGSPRGGYSEKTIRLYASKPILSESDIVDGDEASCRDKITEWVSNFTKVEYPKMNEIIADALREVDAELGGRCGGSAAHRS